MTTLQVLGVDCHAHIIDPERFAFVDGPGYRPHAGEQGTRAAYLDVLRNHAISHAVLVQPSCYAYDNGAMLEAIAASAGRLAGIAVIEDDADDAALDRLQASGVLGVRLNLGAFDPMFFEKPVAPSFLRRMRDRGWLVQVYARSSQWQAIAPMIASSGVTVIIDHFGHPDIDAGVEQAGFQAVLGLARTGVAWIKLAAPYRSSRQDTTHADLTPFMRSAIAAFGIDRCIWGSDWPFINTTRAVTYQSQLDWLAREIPDEIARGKVLVDNPVNLYGIGVGRRRVRTPSQPKELHLKPSGEGQ